MVGLGVTFLLEVIDTSIRSPSHVSLYVSTANGIVPHTDDLEEEIADPGWRS